MFRILIIRHGDPDYENDCLTSQGEKDVGLLAERLEKENIDEIYSSPFGRAKFTAAPFAEKCGKEVKILDFLHEFIGQVILPGGNTVYPWKIPGDFYSAEFEEFNRNDFYKNEKLFDSEFISRFENTRKSLCSFLGSYGFEKCPGGFKGNGCYDKTVALFCHNGLGVLLLSLLCGFPPIQTWQSVFINTSSVTEIDFVRNGNIFYPVCTLLGDNSHLAVKNENFVANV